jgi:hypothetical protein
MSCPLKIYIYLVDCVLNIKKKTNFALRFFSLYDKKLG